MDPLPVQYVTTSDGYRIAYCVSGEGRPLLVISPNFHDIQQVWQFLPVWMEGLHTRFKVVQYDPRGEGMSARGLPEGLELDDYVRDLEAVVDRLQLQRFAIWTLGGRALTAVRYAARHPDRVQALILTSPAATGQTWRPALWVMLPSEDWERFLRAVVPSGLTMEATRARVREYQRTVMREDWNRYMESIGISNVEEDLRSLPMPVLVIHPRDSQSMSAEASMKAAALIPNGRFLLLEGEYFSDTSLQALDAIDSFVRELQSPSVGELTASGEAANMGLSPREVEVLRLIAAGKSNPQIADELVISLNTVQRHVSNILAKTGLTNRTEAAVYFRDRGLG